MSLTLKKKKELPDHPQGKLKTTPTRKTEHEEPLNRTSAVSMSCYLKSSHCFPSPPTPFCNLSLSKRAQAYKRNTSLTSTQLLLLNQNICLCLSLSAVWKTSKLYTFSIISIEWLNLQLGNKTICFSRVNRRIQPTKFTYLNFVLTVHLLASHVYAPYVAFLIHWGIFLVWSYTAICSIKNWFQLSNSI